MTVIDKYIRNNIKTSSEVLAYQLGVSASFVRVRRAIIKKDMQSVLSSSHYTDEVRALLHLIEIRQTGWAVEIAKQRIEYLENKSKI